MAAPCASAITPLIDASVCCAGRQPAPIRNATRNPLKRMSGLIISRTAGVIIPLALTNAATTKSRRPLGLHVSPGLDRFFDRYQGHAERSLLPCATARFFEEVSDVRKEFPSRQSREPQALDGHLLRLHLRAPAGENRHRRDSGWRQRRHGHVRPSV